MFRSSSETTTSTLSEPLSPFSSCSAPSEPTSDEMPDLGAFTTVLRELNYLQPPPRLPNSIAHRSSLTRSSLTYDRSQSESDSDLRQIGQESTVWSHRPIASYLAATDTETDQTSNMRTETGPIDELTDLDYHSHDDQDDLRNDHNLTEELEPSLGYLDEALGFIAAERDRWTAQREAGTAFPNSSDTFSLEPRRKRRRKRTKTPRAHSTTRTSSSLPTNTSSTTNPLSEEGDIDEDDSSSSYEQYSTSNNHSSSTGYLFKSTPATPSRRRERGRQKRQQQGQVLRNSRSTPQLRLTTEFSDFENPRTQYMKTLAKKLTKLFPADKHTLTKVQFKTLPTVSGHHDVGLLGGYVDTRGPAPKGVSGERLIHVFVDHSNILIGLLNYLKRYPHQHPQYRSRNPSPPSAPANNTTGYINPTPNPKPPRHLSHSALALILERGRPVTRRVLVTSSPLYQSMESAEQLGFEVRIFARVPDTGDGMDRDRTPGNGSSSSGGAEKERGRGGYGHGRSMSGDAVPISGQRNGRRQPNRPGHSRRVSGSTSTESGEGGSGSGGFPSAFVRSLGSPSSLPSAPFASMSTPALNNSTSNLSASTMRVRYREQGVDELLQLKLHQALASIDGPPPPGSTIILATGDGNVGQFNEDGFLGSVRTALKKGWRVELYAWEGGLSKAWKREFGEGSEWGTTLAGESAPRFKVIGMEQFGAELVEIYF